LRVMPAGLWRLATRRIAGHKLFAAALVPALLLRADAELGYRWQSWFNDSYTYVRAAVTLTPETTRPSGYSVYLWLLSPFHSFLLVTVSQHLMGLCVAVMIYALARHRFGVPGWAAVLFTLPVLYDGFEIQLEHLVMADTLFLFLAMAAVTVVLWSPRPSWRACLAAGLLLGLSSVVRSTGLPLLAVFGLYLLISFIPELVSDGTRRQGALRLAAGVAAFGVAFAVPVAGYEGWYKSAHGEYAMTDSTGIFLYSRVMTFAECSRMSLPADLRALCTAVPPAKRPIAQAYIWTSASPLDRLNEPKFSPAVNSLAERFAVKAIEAQPADYARVVWDDTVRSFEWNRSVFPNAQTYNAYLFEAHPKGVPTSPYLGYSSPEAYYARGNAATAVVQPFGRVIADYQRYIWLPGTLYGVILLVGLFAVVARWRRAGREALLPWLGSLTLIVAPAATAEFDYRYVTTAVPFACLAAALAFCRTGRPAGEPGASGDWASVVGSIAGGRIAGGEPGGTASLPRRVPGGGLRGGMPDAGHDERDLPADAS
jgi:hypothetical protein